METNLILLKMRTIKTAFILKYRLTPPHHTRLSGLDTTLTLFCFLRSSSTGVWLNHHKIVAFNKNAEAKISAGLKSYCKINFQAALTEIQEYVSKNKNEEIMDFSFLLDGSYETNHPKLLKKEQELRDREFIEAKKIRSIKKIEVVVTPTHTVDPSIEEENTSTGKTLKRSWDDRRSNEDMLQSIPEYVRKLAQKTAVGLQKRNLRKTSDTKGEREEWNFKMSNFIPSSSPSSLYFISSTSATSMTTSSALSSSSSSSSSSYTPSSSSSSFSSFHKSINIVHLARDNDNLTSCLSSEETCPPSQQSSYTDSEIMKSVDVENEKRSKRKRFDVMHYLAHDDILNAAATTAARSESPSLLQKKRRGRRRTSGDLGPANVQLSLLRAPYNTSGHDRQYSASDSIAVP